jgi:lysophospholipase L1-like esterase
VNKFKNSMGFADAERSVEKERGTFRIVILGDSIAASHRLTSYREGFSFLLESSLRKKGHKIEVINLGVIGYNSQQEVELYKSVGRRYDADLVLLAYCLNDTEHHDGHILASLKRLQAKTFKTNTVAEHEYSPLVLRSKLLLLLSYRFRLLFSPQRLASNLNIEQTTAKNTVKDSLKELQNITNSDGARIGVFAFPYFRKFRSYKYQQKHEFIKNVSNEISVPYLDLLPSFLECSGGDASLVSFGLFHPNALGHACAAREIERWLEQNKLFPLAGDTTSSNGDLKG